MIMRNSNRLARDEVGEKREGDMWRDILSHKGGLVWMEERRAWLKRVYLFWRLLAIIEFQIESPRDKVGGE